MSGRWFRFYDEAIDEPKVLRMSPEMRWHWVAILAVASRYGGKIPSDEDVSLLLRTTVSHASEIIGDLVSRGLVDESRGGAREPHNWRKRQFKSDVSTSRVKRFRKRSKSVSETPPDTEQNRAEAEQNSLPNPGPEKPVPSVAPSQASGATVLELVSEDQQTEIPAVLDRRAYPEAFEALWSEYRPIASPNSTKADAHRAWAKLSAADREACWTGLVRYAVWVAEENVKRSAGKRSPVEVKHLATFINRRGWEPFLEEAPHAAAG